MAVIPPDFRVFNTVGTQSTPSPGINWQKINFRLFAKKLNPNFNTGHVQAVVIDYSNKPNAAQQLQLTGHFDGNSILKITLKSLESGKDLDFLTKEKIKVQISKPGIIPMEKEVTLNSNKMEATAQFDAWYDEMYTIKFIIP